MPMIRHVPASVWSANAAATRSTFTGVKVGRAWRFDRSRSARRRRPGRGAVIHRESIDVRVRRRWSRCCIARQRRIQSEVIRHKSWCGLEERLPHRRSARCRRRILELVKDDGTCWRQRRTACVVTSVVPFKDRLGGGLIGHKWIAHTLRGLGSDVSDLEQPLVRCLLEDLDLDLVALSNTERQGARLLVC
jgi:hypothetical protein